ACGTCLVQNPSTTAVNTVDPNVSGVVALSLQNSAGSADHILDIYTNNASPVLTDYFAANGTLNVGASILTTSNNAYDLGASGSTFRTGYFGTSVLSPAVDVAAA